MSEPTRTFDVLTLVPNTYLQRLDKGFVGLVDIMPRLVPEGQTADQAIVQAARVSFGHGTKTVNEDRGLIRYLCRHRHTTPLEMVELKWHCKMPIFVARQWIRHRTANVNEVSGRYSVLKDDFYFPEQENVRAQSTTNKQSSEGSIDGADAEAFVNRLELSCAEAYRQYEAALQAGVGREQARMLLPLNLYTEWYWKIDLHNLFHFLALRCDTHAQWEIRTFAEAMLELIKPVVPWAVEAWDDYHPLRGAISLTRLEVEALREVLRTGWVAPAIKTDNKREQQEWEAKARRLGMEGSL